MRLSSWQNGLDSFFKEVRVFKVTLVHRTGFSKHAFREVPFGFRRGTVPGATLLQSPMRQESPKTTPKKRVQRDRARDSLFPLKMLKKNGPLVPGWKACLSESTFGKRKTNSRLFLFLPLRRHGQNRALGILYDYSRPCPTYQLWPCSLPPGNLSQITKNNCPKFPGSGGFCGNSLQKP